MAQKVLGKTVPVTLEEMLSRLRPKLISRGVDFNTFRGGREGSRGQCRGRTKHSDSASLGQMNTSR